MYTLARDVSAVPTDYGTVLLDERRGEYFTLNPTGELVLRSALSSGDVAEAVTALVAEYSVDRATAEQDARTIVDQLVDAGLLVSTRDGSR
ncbi:lasso peptide biosynthesis PqqD family chaperone [Actinophytocola sp.]|uniref:lasso peptide biosynthesis PqqD family chaperone n=1 Tax=Actinophytocola sp. TaxID=1872138 RepID=UPI00389A92E6